MMRKWKAVALVFLSAAIALPAFAQSQPSEKVTVFAPYVIKKVQTGRRRTPVTTVSVTRSVTYQDIDLTTEMGKIMLAGRVRQAAQDVCNELGRRFRGSIYLSLAEDRDCAKDAENEAMVQVDAVVAASRAGMRSH